MKIEILSENLKKALQIADRLTKKITTLPILQNVLLRTDGSFLNITTTNLEATINWCIPANVIKQGQALAPANFLSNLVSLLGQGRMEIKEEKQNLVIVNKEEEFQIQGQSPDDFPIVPKIDKMLFISIDSNEIKGALEQVVDITSTSSVKPEISGVLFNIEKGKIKIVATDSFRLAEKTILLKDDKNQFKFILPQNSTRDLLSILSVVEGVVVCYFGGNQALFEIQNRTSSEKIEFLSRTIDGQYPNYEEIIPKKTALKAVVKRDLFLSQIKKAGLFSSKQMDVRLTILPKDNKIKVFSQSVEVGRNETYLKADIQGKEIDISFNYKFLIDGLNNIRSTEVLLELNSQENPCLLKPVGDGSFLYVLMPIKSSV